MGTHNQEERLRSRISQTARTQRGLLDQLTQAMESPPGSGETNFITFVERIHRKLRQTFAEQERLIGELRLRELEGPLQYGSYGRLAGQRPMREIVLDVLAELGVPSPPRTISEFVLARYGLPLPTGRFASLRRDEQFAFKKESVRQSRPAFVVPALNAMSLTPIPRLVANSAWEAAQRLIGSRTLRVNHLRTLLALLRCREHAVRTGDERTIDQLTIMISRHAQTVPGAVEPGDRPHIDRIRKAVEAELEPLERPDLEERQAAAKRLLRHSEYHQLWGSPTVLTSEAKASSRG